MGKKKKSKQRGPARMEHVFWFRRWSSLCILCSWHFNGGSGLCTVLLQARLWAEGKHYVILMTTSQGSRGSGRQELFFSQLYRWQLKALRGWVACWRFMIWKGASCWDVDPGLLHSKSMCLITTPQCLSGYYLLQPLLEDLAYDSQLCLFHKDAQAAKWAVAKNSSQCRASQLQDWAHAVCEGQSPGAVLSAAERAAVTQIAVLGGGKRWWLEALNSRGTFVNHGLLARWSGPSLGLITFPREDHASPTWRA